MLLGRLVDVSGETPVPVTYHHQVTNHRDPTAEPVMYYICQEPGQVPPVMRWTIQATVLDKPVAAAFLNRLRRSQVAYDPALLEQQAAIRLAELKHRERVLDTQLHEIQEQMEGNLRAMTLRLTDHLCSVRQMPLTPEFSSAGPRYSLMTTDLQGIFSVVQIAYRKRY